MKMKPVPNPLNDMEGPLSLYRHALNIAGSVEITRGEAIEANLWEELCLAREKMRTKHLTNKPKGA